MKKVFAVNSGTYSDYRIVAIFSTQKLAEEYMAAVPDGEYNEIEEYQVDPPTTDLIRRGYSVWRILMLKNGDIERTDRQDITNYNVTETPSHRIWERTKAVAYKGRGIPDALDSRVWVKTEKQAIKIVNEKRAQMIAAGEWR